MNVVWIGVSQISGSWAYSQVKRLAREARCCRV